MRAHLSVDEEKICFQAPSIKQVGTVRHAPSFEVLITDIKIIGYVPRIIVDDESGFLVFVTTDGSISYFNLDIVDKAAIEKLKGIFNFQLDQPDIPYEETNWHSFIIYPNSLALHPLFKRWNWFTPKGFLKNMGKSLSLDNPAWEQLTNEAQTYLAAIS